MNTYCLNDEVREKFKPQVEEFISLLEEEKIEELDLDLTFKGISPMQLKELLEELGYEDMDLDTNGWEHDFWWYFNNPNKKGYAKKLCISGCSMAFEMKLYAYER